MDTQQIVVTLSGLLLMGGTLWFFFGQRDAVAACINSKEGVQEIEIVVQGGYTPDRIEVCQGQPVRLNFLRRESTDCTEQVILADFGISKHLPQDQTVSVEFTPQQPGEFVFHCGMNMVRGRLVVVPAV